MSCYTHNKLAGDHRTKAFQDRRGCWVWLGMIVANCPRLAAAINDPPRKCRAQRPPFVSCCPHPTSTPAGPILGPPQCPPASEVWAGDDRHCPVSLQAWDSTVQPQALPARPVRSPPLYLWPPPPFCFPLPCLPAPAPTLFPIPIPAAGCGRRGTWTRMGLSPSASGPAGYRSRCGGCCRPRAPSPLTRTPHLNLQLPRPPHSCLTPTPSKPLCDDQSGTHGPNPVTQAARTPPCSLWGSGPRPLTPSAALQSRAIGPQHAPIPGSHDGSRWPTLAHLTQPLSGGLSGEPQ